MTTEYRAVWPNGNLVDQVPPSTDNEAFYEQYFKFVNALKSLKLPQEYLPQTSSVILSPPPQHPSASARHAAQVWEPTPYQIERVKTRQFAWNDPCVICGGHFPECHGPLETELFVNRVKDWLKNDEWKRRQR